MLIVFFFVALCSDDAGSCRVAALQTENSEEPN